VLDILLVAGAVIFVVAVLFALVRGLVGVRREIINALSSAESESEKAEIERRVLKATYPPRFRRD
jgi:flagellar biosynthesis/type III secretory pathway M-ring protein FliF/YscJ